MQCQTVKDKEEIKKRNKNEVCQLVLVACVSGLC